MHIITSSRFHFPTGAHFSFGFNLNTSSYTNSIHIYIYIFIDHLIFRMWFSWGKDKKDDCHCEKHKCNDDSKAKKCDMKTCSSCDKKSADSCDMKKDEGKLIL